MPRLPRTVFAEIPHHITQRGNRRENVFFSDGDRAAYLEWLQLYCEQHAVQIQAYCLMTNIFTSLQHQIQQKACRRCSSLCICAMHNV